MNAADIITATLSIVTIVAGAGLWRSVRNAPRARAIPTSANPTQKAPAAEAVEYAHYAYPAPDRNAASYWAF